MRILLATDGSDYSEEAAGFLRRFNFSRKDEIVVLHVISEVPYEDDYKAQIRQAIKKVAPRILEASANILKPVKAKIGTVESDGYPDSTIIEKAIKSDADLIVMGARGIKGVKDIFSRKRVKEDIRAFGMLCADRKIMTVEEQPDDFFSPIPYFGKGGFFKDIMP